MIAAECNSVFHWKLVYNKVVYTKNIVWVQTATFYNCIGLNHAYNTVK